MENFETYRLDQTGQQTQAILDQVSTNTADIAQLRALYEALTQSEPVIIQPSDTWPVADPQENVIYRVIDRVNTPPQSYSDYMWNGNAMVLMATHDNSIDNEPTPGSNNLVKSGGVAASIVFDISSYHATGSTLATYADLAAALGTDGANVPASVRKGGMSVKFVQSSDNKYVQFFCTADEFTTDVSQWQGVDDEPVADSNNLVKSGGVKKMYFKNENIVTENLFNKNSTTRQNGVAQLSGGDFSYNSIFARTAVNVLPNTTYNLGGLAESTDVHLCFYNGDTYVGGVNIGNQQFTTPANCNIVYLTSLITNYDSIVISKGQIGSYKSYGIQGENIDFDSINNDAIDGKTIKEQSIEPKGLKNSICNHFNKEDENIEENYYLSYNYGVKTANPGWNIVPVELHPGKTYYVSGVNANIHVTFFTGDYNNGGHYTGGQLIVGDTTLNVPAGCEKVYFSCLSSDMQRIMVSDGSAAPLRYVPYGSFLTSEVFQDNSISKKKLGLGNTVLYKKDFNATLDAEFVGATPSNFDSNGLFIGTSTDFITFNREYYIKPRTLRLLATFAPNCVLTVKSSDGDSVATFNLSNNTISCNTYSKNTTVFSSPSDYYLIEIECNFNVGRIRVTNLNTASSDEISATFSGVGGYGEGAIGVEVPGFGLWHDKYMFGVASTDHPCYIKEMSIVVPYQSCDMIVYGDSITEPEGYYPADDFSKSWTQLLKNEASYNVLFSGRGGYGLDAIISTIKNELPYILPKYVMVTIGTNGGVSAANLRTLLNYIIKCGAVPVLNNIPCNEHGTQTSVNAIIKSIREEYSIGGCRFDNATSLAMDGVDVDTTKMYWEDYGGSIGSYYHHPNPKGAKAMITQLKIDIPHIF